MKLDEFKEMMKSLGELRKDATTSGISLATGLSFYYLEPLARTIYPVKFPLLASIPRVSGSFAGMVVGGDGVHWKAITGISSDYPATSEGNRNSLMKLTEKDYFTPFKNLGEEGQVSFQAQQAGLGFEDNIGLAQASLLNQELNDEEKMILFGNSGSASNGGANGFQLGTAPTPTLTAVTSPTGQSPLADNTYYVRCIPVTGWGASLATPTGLSLPFTRTNADGSQDVINGGTAALGASSAGQATTSQSIKATVTAVPGAMGYAWYIGTSNASSAQRFVMVTPAPTITIYLAINPLVAATNQLANASNSTGSFATDNSANKLDFDGLSTWLTNYAPATSGAMNNGNSYWKDLGGAKLTANGDGTIQEFEDVQDFLWLMYKISIDKIWVGGNLIGAVRAAILSGGVANAVTRMVYERDENGRITGGSNPVAYIRKYGPSAGQAIEIETHPWLPQGQILFDLVNNPFPAAGNSIPAVRRMAMLEDHFSIYWPYRKLQHEVGVYAFGALQHYIPFGGGLLTGVSSGALNQ